MIKFQSKILVLNLSLTTAVWWNGLPKSFIHQKATNLLSINYNFHKLHSTINKRCTMVVAETGMLFDGIEYGEFVIFG